MLAGPAGGEEQRSAAFPELEDGIDLAVSAVAVLPVLPYLRQRERRQPVVLHRRRPHAELNKPRVLVPAGRSQAPEVTVEDDLLEVGQMFGRYEVVEGGVGDEVPYVFPDGTETGAAPVNKVT